MITAAGLILYAVFFLLVGFVAIGVPLYALLVVWEVGRAAVRRCRRPSQRALTVRDRTRAEAALREQYAAGTLSLAGFEERIEDLLRARGTGDLGAVVGDLPGRSTGVDRITVALVAVGLALTLSGSVPAHVAGVSTATAAFLPRRWWVVTMLAFASGCLLFGGGAVAGAALAAAAAGLAFVICKSG